MIRTKLGVIGQLLAGVLVAGAAVVTLAIPAPARAQLHDDGATGDAHIRCIQALKKIALAREPVRAAMDANDLEALARLERQIEADAREARTHMDMAFIAGAWKSREIKREGADVMGRMEAIQQLNFISLAFLTGYKTPVRKTPSSVADATTRAFELTGQLLTRLERLNERVAKVAESNTQ